MLYVFLMKTILNRVDPLSLLGCLIFFIYVFVILFKQGIMINAIKELFLVEDIESDVTYAIQNEILPLTPSIELPVAKEPIKFSEIRSRSSNQ